MPGALDQFETLALNGRLRHGDHPLLTWRAANAIVVRGAAINNQQEVGSFPGDGADRWMVAAVMAIAAKTGAPEPGEPSYQMVILA